LNAVVDTKAIHITQAAGLLLELFLPHMRFQNLRLFAIFESMRGENSQGIHVLDE